MFTKYTVFYFLSHLQLGSRCRVVDLANNIKFKGMPATSEAAKIPYVVFGSLSYYAMKKEAEYS